MVQCWHTEYGSPCNDWVCNQPHRLAAGDYGIDPMWEQPEHLEEKTEIMQPLSMVTFLKIFLEHIEANQLPEPKHIEVHRASRMCYISICPDDAKPWAQSLGVSWHTIIKKSPWDKIEIYRKLPNSQWFISFEA